VEGHVSAQQVNILSVKVGKHKTGHAFISLKYSLSKMSMLCQDRSTQEAIP
jgi:hypothetical protein